MALYGFCSGFVWALYGFCTGLVRCCTGFVRALYGLRTGFVRVLYGFCTGVVRVSYGYRTGFVRVCTGIVWDLCGCAVDLKRTVGASTAVVQKLVGCVGSAAVDCVALSSRSCELAACVRIVLAISVKIFDWRLKLLIRIKL